MEEKGIQLCFNPNIHLTVPVSNYCGRRRGLGQAASLLHCSDRGLLLP